MDIRRVATRLAANPFEREDDHDAAYEDWKDQEMARKHGHKDVLEADAWEKKRAEEDADLAMSDAD